jgi:hypothetical protein
VEHLKGNIDPRLEKLARNEHSSLLQKSVNYGQKSFITLAPEVVGKLPEQPQEHRRSISVIKNFFAAQADTKKNEQLSLVIFC